MAELKGSKTEKNLMEAFAGESMARNKYTYYASKARKDGYVQIAELFEETAARLGSPRNTMFRLKEVWGFLRLSFREHEKHYKALRKATTIPEYQGAVARMFRDLELLPEAEINWK